MAETRQVSKLDKTGYGMGNLAFAIPFQCISAFFYFFSTAVLKLSPGIVGLAVSLSVVWDAVTDPVMGYISDYTKNARFGRRHLYLIIGALGTALSNFLLWTIDPADTSGVKLALAIAYMLLCKTFITIYTTPYNALGAELSDNYNERTSIQAVKTGFFIIGFLFPTIAGMLLFFRPAPGYPVGQLNPASYSAMGLTASLLTLVFAAVCYFTTCRHIPHLPAPPSEKGSVKGLYAAMFNALKIGDFRSIALGYLFINLSSALLSVVGMHVMTYTYRLNNREIALVFGILFGVAILSQPLWTLIAARREKKYAVIAALIAGLLGSAGFIPTVFLRVFPQANIFILIAVAAVLGFSTGGCLSLPYSMLADTIDVDELRTGTRKEGVFYGTVTFMYKLSQAVVVLALGIILGAVGFNAELAEQPHGVAVAIGLILPVGSIVAFSCAYLFFKNYSLDREKIKEIQKQIDMKKEANP
jgi:GPH family glycoside/pentoside/hexuronide:cation symporter